ncbi:unnamed protein product [Clonostachys solani]|uniref:Histidine decarboxylase n=1 Tax=Clonostachys solani TaxID=160281 RepID=A0A9N9ZEH2_9HYPO|nr:unnamed protein product [Clonostachys solani]
MNNPHPPSTNDKIIQKTFHGSRSQWIYDPVMTQWRKPDHHIHQVLPEADKLYNQWKSANRSPLFAPSTCPLWLDTGRVLANIGLPWHNNQVNMPDQTDSSWPFHFKTFEKQVLQSMGARIGDPNPSGYVCSYSEANCYCIRTLQQQLRRTHPAQRPIVVYDHFDLDLIHLFETLFGLETYQVSLAYSLQDLEQELVTVTSNRTRPIIFAASISNSATEYDDIGVILELSREFPVTLHVNAFRSFDYVASMSETVRRHEGAHRFALRSKHPAQPLTAPDGCVIASSLVGGGLIQSPHAPAAALTPMSYRVNGERVAYIRSFDSTLGGSRDATSPLWLALYQLRLGDLGVRQLCDSLRDIRSSILRVLQSQGMDAHTSPYCLDIVVTSFSVAQKHRLLKLGGSMARTGAIVLVVQTQLLAAEIFALVPAPAASSCWDDPLFMYRAFLDHYPIPPDAIEELKTTIQSWRCITRSTIGYPVHMGSLSALGSIIGRFWELDIPQDWLDSTSKHLLATRFEAFGVPSWEQQRTYKGGFTNGSTMGNRSGIHTAFQQYPDAFLYVSNQAHYSVLKALRDCDTISNIWSGEKPQYSQISSTSDGSICIDALVAQALTDQRYCFEKGREYRMILFANIGTTFLGARDDLPEIVSTLKKFGITISHIHADGALDFGYNNCGISLGPPGTIGLNGMPNVQGITVSHHKALGQSVSGEVFCFSPNSPIAGLASSVNPRIIFETWLYSRVYQPKDIAFLLNSCQGNASRLEANLKRLGLITKRYPDSLVVTFERPPSWIIEEFSLRPEGDWVHIITMPHVSAETIEVFLDRIETVTKACSAAFSSIAPILSDTIGQDIQLRRVQSQGTLAEQVASLANSALPLYSAYNADLDRILGPSIRSAISVAAVDEEGKIQVVFLAAANRDESILINPLLIRSTLAPSVKDICDIRTQLMSLMMRYLKVEMRIDTMSHDIYTFDSD